MSSKIVYLTTKCSHVWKKFTTGKWYFDSPCRTQGIYLVQLFRRNVSHLLYFTRYLINIVVDQLGWWAINALPISQYKWVYFSTHQVNIWSHGSFLDIFPAPTSGLLNIMACYGPILTRAAPFSLLLSLLFLYFHIPVSAFVMVCQWLFPVFCCCAQAKMGLSNAWENVCALLCTWNFSGLGHSCWPFTA